MTGSPLSRKLSVFPLPIRMVHRCQGLVIQYRLARRCRMPRVYSAKRAAYITTNAGPAQRWMLRHGWKVWQ